MDQHRGAALAPYLDDEAAAKKVQRGANWFFVVAALSLVNTAAALAGSDRSFVVGLAVTQVADGFARALVEQGGSASARAVAVAFDAAVVGLFVAAGLLARRRVAWTFAAGMALYLLDGAVCTLLAAWVNLAFHGLVLFYLWSGFAALRAIRAAAAPPVAVNPLVR